MRYSLFYYSLPILLFKRKSDSYDFDEVSRNSKSKFQLVLSAISELRGTKVAIVTFDHEYDVILQTNQSELTTEVIAALSTISATGRCLGGVCVRTCACACVCTVCVGVGM